MIRTWAHNENGNNNGTNIEWNCASRGEWNEDTELAKKLLELNKNSLTDIIFMCVLCFLITLFPLYLPLTFNENAHCVVFAAQWYTLHEHTQTCASKHAHKVSLLHIVPSLHCHAFRSLFEVLPCAIHLDIFIVVVIFYGNDNEILGFSPKTRTLHRLTLCRYLNGVAAKIQL